MAKISNNLIASLLIVAILVSGFGLVTIINMGVISLTGMATGTGTANVTITGVVAIEMVRNLADFDSGTLDGARRILTTQQDNYGTSTFDSGSEGNGSNYAGCDGTETNCAFPFVVRNTGNVNASINVSSASEATTWIGGTNAGAYVKGSNNETAACGLNFTQAGNLLEGLWGNLNVSERVICNQMDYRDTPNQDEIRLHFNISIPDDAVGTKGVVVTVGAIQAS